MTNGRIEDRLTAALSDFDNAAREATRETHVLRAGGPVHAFDCPACVTAANDRAARDRNPHRPGTKAAARWERLNNAGLAACDPRTETYWSM